MRNGTDNWTDICHPGVGVKKATSWAAKCVGVSDGMLPFRDKSTA